MRSGMYAACWRHRRGVCCCGEGLCLFLFCCCVWTWFSMPTADQLEGEDICELSVFPLSRSSGEKRKRRSDSSEEEALKPYECRFCPMKFAKSQALGGHMNRHRQEREREQLLHARQLVLQQGLSWVSGQNSKQLGSRLAAPLTSPGLQSNFQLSSSLQSSLSWNISGSPVPKLADDESSNRNISLMQTTPRAPAYSPRSSCDNMLQPYNTMVQHARPNFGSGDRSSFASADTSDMLTMAYDKSQQLALECTSRHLNSYTSHASEVCDEHEHQQQHLDSPSRLERAPAIQLVAESPSPPDFPSLHLGSGTSDIPSLQQLSSEHLSPLQMAVDCECHQAQLGGYHNMGFSTDDMMSAGSAQVSAPWDGFSWIFNNNNSQKVGPSSEDHGFCLSLSNNQQLKVNNEETVTSNIDSGAINGDENSVVEAVAAVAAAVAPAVDETAENN